MSDKKPSEKMNSLTSFVEGVANAPMINRQDTAIINNRFSLIFTNRAVLSELYIEHGLVQTLIDMPVDDAFRKDFEIKTTQINEEEIEKLQRTLHRDGHYKNIMQAVKWGRLFGGSGLVIMTEQDPTKPLDLRRMKEDSKIEFYPADLWELNKKHQDQNPMAKELSDENPYLFYGNNLHKSRVLLFKGKEAPSLQRRQMRGWGMTEVERFLRSFNQYVKNNNVIFELLDEAKIDVFKIDGLNTALATPQGTKQVTDRVQSANMIKSYLNALTMDIKDEYDQKQVNFAGLGDMLQEIRIGVASDLKMPLTKLFGVSSAGFNSGEDDIENYNSMVEGEIRAKVKPICLKVVEIVCSQLFGMVPDDLEIEFPALRVLSAEQEETVKTSQFNRIINSFDRGLISSEVAKQALNKADLVGVKVEENDEVFETYSDISLNLQDKV